LAGLLLSRTSGGSVTVSSADLETVRVFAEENANALARIITEHIKLTETTIEALEKQLATLALGYAEQAVILESLVGQLTFGTDEERKAFQESMNEQRREMFNIMREGANVLADDDPGLASALEDAVTERETNSTS
jgi:hypothetical protein